MWQHSFPQCAFQRFGEFRPLEILYEFEVPMIFTFSGEDGEFLAYLSAEDDETQLMRYLAVPANQKLIDELKTGVKTVFEALNQPWLWIVDIAYSGEIKTAWRVSDIEHIPDVSKPTKDAMLWPELMPFFSYRLIGEGLEKGRVPASVVSRAISGTTAAIKRLMLAVSATAVAQGRPEKWLKQLCDLPTQSFAYNSFEVSFRSGVDPVQSDMTGLDLDPYCEGHKKLTLALEWLMGELDTELDLTMLEVLSSLVPPSHGIIKEAEIKGQLVGSTVVRLKRNHTDKVRKAISSVKRESPLLATEGSIGELDKDKFSFTLRQRPNNQPELNCFFEENAYDDVSYAFFSESSVRVVGRLLPNRLNTLEVVAIEFMDVSD